ncbi:MAG: hypothetical protein H7Z72_21000 [Bacteroidetes bacterium]|nr:hypothetical protein [Fibrella sp.]
MKTITITLDLKSLCIGALGVLAVVSLSNFNKADEKRADTTDEVRRYMAIAGDRETIILDTKTGKFILNPGYVGRPRWIKGDFSTTHDEK